MDDTWMFRVIFGNHRYKSSLSWHRDAMPVHFAWTCVARPVWGMLATTRRLAAATMRSIKVIAGQEVWKGELDVMWSRFGNAWVVKVRHGFFLEDIRTFKVRNSVPGKTFGRNWLISKSTTFDIQGGSGIMSLILLELFREVNQFVTPDNTALWVRNHKAFERWAKQRCHIRTTYREV